MKPLDTVQQICLRKYRPDIEKSLCPEGLKNFYKWWSQYSIERPSFDSILKTFVTGDSYYLRQI